MEIRRLTAADAQAFRAVRLEALAAHPADFGSDAATERTRPLSHFVVQLLDNHVMGAFVDGEPMGIMALEFRGQAKTRHRAFLWGVYVRPGARGQGVAPALLDATLAVAFAGAEQVELGVRIGNAAAERLYASRGFVRYGVEHACHRVDGVDHDDALMVNLGAGR
jgi:ribosomal protein S18 acetylase RimI-like enzyme